MQQYMWKQEKCLENIVLQVCVVENAFVILLEDFFC